MLILKKDTGLGDGWYIGIVTEVVEQDSNYVYLRHPLYEYLLEPFTYKEIEEYFEPYEDG